MQITVTTWNINSVRFRIDLVAKFIKAVQDAALMLRGKAPVQSRRLEASEPRHG